MLRVLKLFSVAVAGALALWAATADAHHSAAPFDFNKLVTIDGTVKKFHVINPHTVAVVTVTDAKGSRDVEYEGHSASNFYRLGYVKDAVKPGEKISILIAPRKDGGDGGFIMSFTTASGLTVAFGGLSPSSGKVIDRTTGETSPAPKP